MINNKKSLTEKQKKLRKFSFYSGATLMLLIGSFGFLFPEKIDAAFGLGIETTKLIFGATMIMGVVDFAIFKFIINNDDNND